MAVTTTTEKRSSVWEWAQVVILGLNLGWTTLCLGGYRPETMVFTSAVNGLLLTLHLIESALGSRRSHPAGWLLLPFLVYAALNVWLVTPVGWLGWRDWLGWAQMIAVFWVVINGVRLPAARTALLSALVAVAVGSASLGFYQRFVSADWLMMGRTQAEQFIGRSSGSFGIPNSLAALLLLVLPALGVLTFRRGASAVQRVFFGYLLLLCVFGLVLTVSRGAWIALALALAGWTVCATHGSVVRRLRLAAGVILATGILVAGLFYTVPMVRARLGALRTDSGERTRPIMWRGAWGIFIEHPSFGGGAGAYNYLFEKHRPEDYKDQPVWAHNDYLNTLSDYGVTGFALFFGACGVVTWCCWRQSRHSSAPKGGHENEALLVQAQVVGVTAFSLQLFIDFHFKIPALAMAFGVVAALVVQNRWPVPTSHALPPSCWHRRLTWVSACAVAYCTFSFAIPLYRGEALRYKARQSIDLIATKGLSVAQWPALLNPASEELRRAVEVDPSNGAAWSDLAYALALSALMDPARIPQLGREAENAASRALACSTVPPEFWVRHGVALDMQGRWRGAHASFAEAIRLGPARAATWYNYAYHLSLIPGDPRPALIAVDHCLRLDHGNREGQALRQRLATRVRAH